MQYFVFSLKCTHDLLKVASLTLKPPLFLPRRVSNCTASIAFYLQLAARKTWLNGISEDFKSDQGDMGQKYKQVREKSIYNKASINKTLT